MKTDATITLFNTVIFTFSIAFLVMNEMRVADPQSFFKFLKMQRAMFDELEHSGGQESESRQEPKKSSKPTLKIIHN